MTPSCVDYPAHSVPLGLAFVTSDAWPDGTKLGRSAGVLMRADGVTFVSDDQSGVIYRLAPIR